MKNILATILRSTGYRWVLEKLDTTYVTKSRVSLLSIIRMFIQQMQKDHIQERASAMAFNFMLSIFPGIIFIFTLIPYIPLPHLQDSIMSFIHAVLPHSIYLQAKDTIIDIISKERSGLLSFGFVFAIYAANNGTNNMITAFNKCYRTKDDRSFLHQMLVSLGITLFISALTFSAIAASIVVELYSSLLLETLPAVLRHNLQMVGVLKNLLIFVMFYLAVSFIYFHAPALHKKWNYFSIGSFIASTMIMLFTAGFAFYINKFNSYNKIYGSIGALIGLMLWFYAISMVLLIGFEINASIHRAKHAIHRENLDSEV